MRSHRTEELARNDSGLAPADRLRSELVEHARSLIAREGSQGLTMRALASEAGCALGLPYKVFQDRGDLVMEILRVELGRLHRAGRELVGRAGDGGIGENLAQFAETILASPAVALSAEVVGNAELAERFARHVNEDGTGPADFESAIREYLEAERDLGRVRADVELGTIAFLLAGSVHNLVMSGPAYPRPSRADLRLHMSAVAALIHVP